MLNPTVLLYVPPLVPVKLTLAVPPLEQYGPVSYTHLDVYKRQEVKVLEFKDYNLDEC